MIELSLHPVRRVDASDRVEAIEGDRVAARPIVIAPSGRTLTARAQFAAGANATLTPSQGELLAESGHQSQRLRLLRRKGKE